ncbi:hypothetical protein RDWZM_005874 [Blomia tropicalis]|uniref:C3H1-type domain-containing protein n=1 Tax=Blomia tropicalis TaxID=40697 RepID=A0A9Q0M8J6_BLOTA|nr:hypothetical protein RDWZM_005874 [Blomia tropicalis]
MVPSNLITITKAKKRYNRKHKFNPATKHCLIFCKTGNCVKGAKCLFVHDLLQVAVCQKFLTGRCNKQNCLLSHKPTPNKMPDCTFFLKGCCKLENCSYRHVKVSQDAIICQEFLNGYCPQGVQCAKSHRFLCKKFNQTGTCEKGEKCTMAHQKINITNQKEEKLAPARKNNNDFSKYKKINNIQGTSAKSETLTVETANPNVIDSNNQNESDRNHTILNHLLKKRIKMTIESNKQIVSVSKNEFAIGSDFISISCNDDKDIDNTKKVGDNDKVNHIINDAELSNHQCESQQKIQREGLESGKSINNMQSNPNQLKKPKKYFYVDSDDESLSDYYCDLRIVNNNCRPQLKIIPDFLAIEKNSDKSSK